MQICSEALESCFLTTIFHNPRVKQREMRSSETSPCFPFVWEGEGGALALSFLPPSLSSLFQRSFFTYFSLLGLWGELRDKNLPVQNGFWVSSYWFSHVNFSYITSSSTDLRNGVISVMHDSTLSFGGMWVRLFEKGSWTFWQCSFASFRTHQTAVRVPQLCRSWISKLCRLWKVMFIYRLWGCTWWYRPLSSLLFRPCGKCWLF